MAFGDDLNDMGALPEEPKLAISRVILENDFGEYTVLEKEHPVEDITTQLYLMAAKKTLYSTFAGTDAFSRRHYEFHWDAENTPVGETVGEFIDAGWIITFERNDP